MGGEFRFDKSKGTWRIGRSFEISMNSRNVSDDL